MRDNNRLCAGFDDFSGNVNAALLCAAGAEFGDDLHDGDLICAHGCLTYRRNGYGSIFEER